MALKLNPDTGLFEESDSEVVTNESEKPTVRIEAFTITYPPKSEVTKALDEVESRAKSDEKSTTNLNEAILEHNENPSKTVDHLKLMQIKSVLKNGGMDSQMQERSIKQIQEILSGN